MKNTVANCSLLLLLCIARPGGAFSRNLAFGVEAAPTPGVSPSTSPGDAPATEAPTDAPAAPTAAPGRDKTFYGISPNGVNGGPCSSWDVSLGLAVCGETLFADNFQEVVDAADCQGLTAHNPNWIFEEIQDQFQPPGCTTDGYMYVTWNTDAQSTVINSWMSVHVCKAVDVPSDVWQATAYAHDDDNCATEFSEDV